MCKVITRTISGLFLVSVTFIGSAAAQQNNGRGRFDMVGPARLQITSTSFEDMGEYPKKFTCEAKPAAVSPQVQWSNVPKDTASLVLMFHDMDPRVDKGNNDTMHWLVWNIPANVTALPEGMTPAQSPEGTLQLSSNNRTGYFGPCMPFGSHHHYLLEVYAMDQKLDVPATGTRTDIFKAMDGHILDHALMLAYWRRPIP
jgi:Raf kinase inhibitor-like YbhB/YbcL family protein